MCGIAGIIDFDSIEAKESLLCRMLGLIRHRGPDAFGIYTDKIAGLASARLSIIDLPGGDQPIHNEDKSVWVVYNGEIYNYPELRQDLKARGHQFYTGSDTEVLVHLYEERGPELFRELNGQFAFALWDQRRESLLLGRDRLGVRPLFYHHKNGRLIFGSEIKAIFAHPEIPRALNLQTLSDIFTCWAPLGESTSFQDIYQLLPGHYAIFSRRGLATRSYWQLPFENNSKEHQSLTELIAELQQLLYDATRIRLRADVPVGAYLSGGLDSTYTTSIVKHFFNNKLCTFSVSFTDGRFDEAPFQAKAVGVLGTDHRSICCTEQDIGETFPQVIWHTETPILRTAPAPLFLLSRLVRENNFKVVLTGEGSDEIFGGYDIFKEDRVRRFWARNPQSKMRPILLQRLYPDIFLKQYSRIRPFWEESFRTGLSELNSPVYSHMIRWENTAYTRGFFSFDLRGERGKENDFVDRFASTLPTNFMNWDPLSRAQYIEITIFLSNYLLSSQGDRMAMAHSVEGRFPFLDHRVVEFACKIPPRYRLQGLKEKYLLRKSAADLIPPELAQRIKQPYRAPISRCFLGGHSLDYVEDLLSENALQRTGYFDPSKVARLLAKCRKQEGHLLSERENMAVVGIISTQLLDQLFIRHFPPNPIQEPEEVKRFEG
jgi:asparagine synthase (glutamine-hydrolysing)